MATKVLSIEVGNDITHIVETDYKARTPKVYEFFQVPTPEGVLVDGSIRTDRAFVEQIQRELRTHRVKTRKVIFVMNSTRIANREIEIPLVREKQIHNLLITNAVEFFPVNLMQYQLVHQIIEKREDERKYKLSVLAVPKEIIRSYQQFATALNLEVAALDYVGNSIAQGMLRMIKTPVKVTLKVDEEMSMLTVISGDRVRLQRNISYGAAGDEEELEALAGNVSRMIDYYASRNEEIAIEKVYLMGMGAECKGLAERLNEVLGIPVEAYLTLPQMLAPAEYLVPLAATLAPLNFTLSEKSQTEDSKKSDGMFPARVVCTVGLGLAVILTAVSIIPWMMQEGRTRRLEREVTGLEDVADTYKAYQAAKTKYDELADMYELTETPADQLPAFFDEMETKMPSDLVVVSMTAGADGINLDMTTQSKESAAEALVQLRGFSSIYNISTSGLTESVNEDGVSVVSFSVNCNFTAGTGVDATEGEG